MAFSRELGHASVIAIILIYFIMNLSIYILQELGTLKQFTMLAKRMHNELFD